MYYVYFVLYNICIYPYDWFNLTFVLKWVVVFYQSYNKKVLLLMNSAAYCQFFDSLLSIKIMICIILMLYPFYYKNMCNWIKFNLLLEYLYWDNSMTCICIWVKNQCCCIVHIFLNTFQSTQYNLDKTKVEIFFHVYVYNWINCSVMYI